MIDRHLVGDVALAVLLAVPTLAMAQPQATVAQPTATGATMGAKAAIAERTSVERRYSLPN